MLCDGGRKRRCHLFTGYIAACGWQDERILHIYTKFFTYMPNYSLSMCGLHVHLRRLSGEIVGVPLTQGASMTASKRSTTPTRNTPSQQARREPSDIFVLLAVAVPLPIVYPLNSPWTQSSSKHVTTDPPYSFNAWNGPHRPVYIVERVNTALALRTSC